MGKYTKEILVGVAIILIGGLVLWNFSTVDATEEAVASVQSCVLSHEKDIESLKAADAKMERKADERFDKIDSKIDGLSEKVNKMAGAIEFMAEQQGYKPDKGDSK